MNFCDSGKFVPCEFLRPTSCLKINHGWHLWPIIDFKAFLECLNISKKEIRYFYVSSCSWACHSWMKIIHPCLAHCHKWKPLITSIMIIKDEIYVSSIMSEIHPKLIFNKLFKKGECMLKVAQFWPAIFFREKKERKKKTFWFWALFFFQRKSWEKIKFNHLNFTMWFDGRNIK